MLVIIFEELSIQVWDVCEIYLDYWNLLFIEDGQEVDVFIMFVVLYVVVIFEYYLYIGYIEVVNFLDYLVFVIFVMMVDKFVDVVDFDFELFNDLDVKNWKGYDVDIYDGVLVGLQIVGRKYEEEKIWVIVKIFDVVLRNLK